MKKENGITLIVGVIILVVLLVLLVTATMFLLKGSSSSNNMNTDKNSTNNIAKSNYTIKINNMSISLPCKYEDIIKAGFQMQEEDIEKLKNSTKGSICAFYPVEKGGYLSVFEEFFAYIKAVDGKDINKAEVVGIHTRQYNTEMLEYEVSINGLKIGEAIYQDAVEKFGDASADSTGETEFISLYNSKDGKIRLTFTNNENMVKFFVCTEAYYNEHGAWTYDDFFHI